jgi:hypothetical protein
LRVERVSLVGVRALVREGYRQRTGVVIRRDLGAIIRSLAFQKDYGVDRAPRRGTWFLTDRRTGIPAVKLDGTSVFTEAQALRFLKALPVPG